MAKKKIESYSQCILVQEGTGITRVETTGYIDARQATVGSRMTLKGVEGIWKVEKAGPAGPPPRHTSWGGMD